MKGPVPLGLMLQCWPAGAMNAMLSSGPGSRKGTAAARVALALALQNNGPVLQLLFSVDLIVQGASGI